MTFGWGAHSVYRQASRPWSPRASQLRHAALVQARDALDIAAWTLDAAPRGRRELTELNELARESLAHATAALSRAGVHQRGVRTLARPVILSGLRDLRAERGRLKGITDQLLWWNHQYLPARAKVLPLAPEEEAQLARVHRILAGQQRLEGLSRHRWFMAFALAGALTPVLGPAAGLAAIAFGSLEIAGLARANGLGQHGDG